MTAGRIVAVLLFVTLAALAVQAAAHAIAPVLPLLIGFGIVVTAAIAIFRFRKDRW